MTQMPTPIQLATGLGGVIGSDYVQSGNQVYFVEFNGKLSVLDLVRPLDTIVFSGTATMPANSSLDLVNGTSAQGGHIRWDHTSPDGKLVMRPQGNCGLSYVGTVDFDTITQAELQNLSYSSQTILHGEAPNIQLTNGTVFGVINNSLQPAANFDIVKVQVLQNAGGIIKVRWVSYRLKPRLRLLGIGYNQPEDIKVTSGGRYAYVTERVGNFLRVDLTNANRPAAQLVASGLTAPHQIALDEEHGQAYMPEFTNAATGKIWRVDLSGGVKTAVFTGLQGCTGLLISKDLRYAYVAEQVGAVNRVARINLATAQRDVLATGLTAPFFMEWADTTESRIILAERDPANHITMLDLTATPVKVTPLLPGVAFRPSSVVLTKPGTMIVCSDSEIDQYDLVSSAFALAGPLFMGIGLVPVDHIINTGDNNTDGYADTTDNPGYLIQVKDAPFGGTLAIMVNHNAALLAGATYYKLFVSQVTPAATPPMEPRQGFSDYLWKSASNSFVPQATYPDPGGFYPVRLPVQIWYNPLLGYMLDTSILSNGLCIIDIKLYNAAKVEIPVGSIHSRRVKIDNQWPVANIEKIFHDGAEVPVCAIVNSGSDQFTFRITATDPQGHLLSWNLSVLWGDNKSAAVGGDSYSNHVSPTRQWAGVASGPPDVPSPAWKATVAGDSTSTHCAHTFYLGVWDRVINGYGYLHYQTYHKSITIWL
jgi:hypothetical protein